MISRIDQDHSRFREIVRGKVRENLRRYMSRGDIIAPSSKGTVTIPMPQITIPRFSFGGKGKGGVGQGEGEPGDPVSGQDEGKKGGPGEAGEGEGDKALEVEVSLEELAEILQLVASNRFAPVMDRTYPLSDLVEAHFYVETGRKRGNVVVA